MGVKAYMDILNEIKRRQNEVIEGSKGLLTEDVEKKLNAIELEWDSAAKRFMALSDETENQVKEKIENLSTIVNSGMESILEQMSSDRIGEFIDQQFAEIEGMFSGVSGITPGMETDESGRTKLKKYF